MSESHILVVDDEPDIRELVRDILEDEGYAVSTAGNGETARAEYSARQPDLVLLDIWMPDVDGISLLKEWQQQDGNRSTIVMMSGHGSVETAVEATRSGAFDFIEKPLSMGKLLLTVRMALEAEQRLPQAETQPQPRELMEPLGSSVHIQSLRQKAQRAAEHDAPVLIQGEPGSGKETLARFIHGHSARAAEPFLVLDQMALAGANSAEQLLLGDGPRSGVLQQAGRGSLYVPELCELDPLCQQLLHGVMESGRYRRKNQPEAVAFQARIMAGCTQSAESLVRSGKLNEALYFRLNVLPMEIPSLRQRPEDVPELVKFFSDYFPQKEQLPYRHFSVSAQNRLRNYAWPGNIRELRNLIKRLLIMGQTDEISAQEVDEAIRHNELNPEYSSDSGHAEIFELPLREAREQFEREYLTYQLRKAGGSVGKLSESVGMERTHLYRKLRALGIDPKSVVKSG